jgi:hypothetical protein
VFFLLYVLVIFSVLSQVYDHKIFRYLENPIESLISIKDEDLIVAYRLPAGHNKLVRLEIVHQRADRCVNKIIIYYITYIKREVRVVMMTNMSSMPFYVVQIRTRVAVQSLFSQTFGIAIGDLYIS